MRLIICVVLVASCSREPTPERPRPSPIATKIDPGAVARTEATFETVMLRGGTLYTTFGTHERCTAVRVLAQAPDATEGTISWRVTDEGQWGTTGYGYWYAPDTDTLTILGPNTFWDAGGAAAVGCGQEIHVTYRENRVEAFEVLYLTEEACTTSRSIVVTQRSSTGC